MERLWTPWRLSYVTGASDGVPRCIFCEAASSSPEHEALVVLRAQHAFVILNRYPYNNGHLMVVTNRHVPSLELAIRDERQALIELTRYSEMALTEAYTPHGMNIGVNLGRPAGAGVVGHLHVHLVPRWNGDTSFMSVVGNVRVLPEELGQTAERLRPIFERLARDDV
jgi:ATP adenylyltransferase